MITLKTSQTEALAHIRKESLDIYNRLHSIAEDIHFVEWVYHTSYAHLPILPNLRCGAWYVNPQIAKHGGAYFKSTDGHTNNWGFNLRRPNLHLLPIILQHNGIVLVDSTRAGKRMPDALSKTVPIWCTVINRAIKFLYSKDSNWNTELYCPPGVVSSQEQSQISQRLDDWAASLVSSSYVLPDLPRPLRPVWITPSTSTLPVLSGVDFLPIICVSASKQIDEGLERRSHGYVYVQGSGDDHELWGMGLTPQIFWEHKHELLKADRTFLPDLVTELVEEHRSRQSAEWKELPTPIHKIRGKLLIASTTDIPTYLPSSLPGSSERIGYVVITDNPSTFTHANADDMGGEARDDVLLLEMSEGKRGQTQFLQSVLPRAIPFIEAKLSKGTKVCVCCHNGKDASVGVVLVALQLYFDANGQFVKSAAEREVLRSSADKKSLSTRLQWIISSRAQANPSRATLKRVNEFLLTPAEFRSMSRSPQEVNNEDTTEESSTKIVTVDEIKADVQNV
ncbi:initiator tRNA phosphoribosyl transferase [Panus rudis PR-1116 ss-1]|nr:initiator tRNA phosphoribosyl transferase [Panus rudis PR-1116 ss-1]